MPAYRALWSVALALLIGIVAELILVDADWKPPVSRPPAVPAVAGVKVPAGANSALLSEISQRPLFLEARRPPEPVVAEAPPAAPAVNPLDGVELLGVYESGGRAGVILRSGGEVTRIAAGSEWQGRHLLGVSANKAIFASADGTSQELPLVRQPQQGGMVAAPAAPPDKGKKPDASAARPAAPADRAAALRAARERAAQTRAAQTRAGQAQKTPPQPTPAQ